MTSPVEARFFRDATALRRWFARHHASASKLFLGYWKVGSGEKSVTWPESVKEALCVGWIDGVRKRIDAQCYMVRFTPRKASSICSAVNIARMQVLQAEGRLHDAGRAAFAAQRENKSGVYSFEQTSIQLPVEYVKRLEVNRQAWSHFEARAPSYRKAVMWWIVSAKQEATRLRRLAQLIEHGERGALLYPFSRR